jgi:hypothetical protein
MHAVAEVSVFEGRLRHTVAPLALFPPCFRYPAAPRPARPRHPWRSRAFGGGALKAADRKNLAKKEVTSVGRKEESRRKEEGCEEVFEEEVVSL